MSWDKITDHLFEKYCVEGRDDELSALMEAHDKEVRNRTIAECVKIIEETVWRDTDMLVENIKTFGGVDEHEENSLTVDYTKNDYATAYMECVKKGYKEAFSGTKFLPICKRISTPDRMELFELWQEVKDIDNITDWRTSEYVEKIHNILQKYGISDSWLASPYYDDIVGIDYWCYTYYDNLAEAVARLQKDDVANDDWATNKEDLLLYERTKRMLEDLVSKEQEVELELNERD